MLGRVYRKFRGENDSPLVNYVVVIQDNDSNNPARLYDSNGNLLSPHGEVRTNSEGEIDVYILDGQTYKLSLLHPISRLVLSVEKAVDPGAEDSDFESDTQLSKTEVTQIRNLLQSGVAGGQAQIAFQDEGVTLGDIGNVQALNFVGALVTATRVGNTVTVTIDGSGSPGQDGASAYEIAVQNGFVGTEQEWLASLVGPQGPPGPPGPPGDVSGALLAPIALGATPRVGRMYPIIPAAGKRIRSVDSVTLSASTGTAGNFGITATRPLAILSTYVYNKPEIHDWAQLGLPEIANDACLMLLTQCSTTSTGSVRGQLRIAHG